MYFFKRVRLRPKYSYSSPEKPGGGKAGKVILILMLAVGLFLVCSSVFLKNISSRIAVSDAEDAVTIQINRVISELMEQEGYTGDRFVKFQKSDSGDVTAISADMVEINALSAKILDRVVASTENSMITVNIPLGNLTGVNVLMGRGPDVPVQVIVLTSSRVDFKNSIVSAGINQIKHQITLEVIVDIDILIPWDTLSTQVVSEVLISDTVVVGKVPDTYLNMK